MEDDAWQARYNRDVHSKDQETKHFIHDSVCETATTPPGRSESFYLTVPREAQLARRHVTTVRRSGTQKPFILSWRKKKLKADAEHEGIVTKEGRK